MERMEVDHCAGAAGGALRRSNSAPMITSVGKRMAVTSQPVTVRYRRVSVNCSCPSQEDNMDAALRGNLQGLGASGVLSVPSSSQWHEDAREWVRSQDSAITPNSSPSPSRRFRPVGGANVRWPALTPLKRKGGVESDGPPKKLFVTGVLDSTHHSSYARLTCRLCPQRCPQSSVISVCPPPALSALTPPTPPLPAYGASSCTVTMSQSGRNPQPWKCLRVTFTTLASKEQHANERRPSLFHKYKLNSIFLNL
uniref:uncharacterized protein LOC131138447 isoform X2 n=1 Tax=Doryrhamphus excisus TaxID=161450 RepID=UPI0025AEB307|nr:uncharacterized protein LOC131138447 isoform X2 [Doryrhamphus excisus]